MIWNLFHWRRRTRANKRHASSLQCEAEQLKQCGGGPGLNLCELTTHLVVLLKLLGVDGFSVCDIHADAWDKFLLNPRCQDATMRVTLRRTGWFQSNVVNSDWIRFSSSGRTRSNWLEFVISNLLSGNFCLEFRTLSLKSTVWNL